MRRADCVVYADAVYTACMYAAPTSSLGVAAHSTTAYDPVNLDKPTLWEYQKPGGADVVPGKGQAI